MAGVVGLTFSRAAGILTDTVVTGIDGAAWAAVVRNRTTLSALTGMADPINGAVFIAIARACFVVDTFGIVAVGKSVQIIISAVVADFGRAAVVGTGNRGFSIVADAVTAIDAHIAADRAHEAILDVLFADTLTDIVNILNEFINRTGVVSDIVVVELSEGLSKGGALYIILGNINTCVVVGRFVVPFAKGVDIAVGPLQLFFLGIEIALVVFCYLCGDHICEERIIKTIFYVAFKRISFSEFKGLFSKFLTNSYCLFKCLAITTSSLLNGFREVV